MSNDNFAIGMMVIIVILFFGAMLMAEVGAAKLDLDSIKQTLIESKIKKGA